MSKRPYNDVHVFLSAGAGLWTTPNDQIKFYRMLMSLCLGCKTIEVKPFLGDLDWAEGAMALPNGESIRVRIGKAEDGGFAVDVSAPEWVDVRR